MIEVFAGVCLSLALTLMIGMILLKKVKNAVTPSIRYLFAMAAITIVSYVTAVVVQDQRAATLAYGLYFAFTDWLVIVLLLYAEKYTEIVRKNRVGKILTYAGALLDTVSMVVNVFTHHVFKVEQTELLIGGESYFAVADKRPRNSFSALAK